MHTHDTARAITLHHLRHDFTLRASGDSWTQALRNVWPDTFFVVLVREAAEGTRYVATYIATGGEHMHYQADSHQDAVAGMREQWQAYLDAHPEELPRRFMMQTRRELHSGGVDMVRHEHRWNRLMDHLGRHQDARDRRAAMADFLDTVAPFVPDRLRSSAIRRTETLPTTRPRALSRQTRRNLSRATAIFRAQQGVSHA